METGLNGRKQYKKLPVSVLESFEKVDEAVVEQKFLEELQDFCRKIVVLDDDPTGVQTVHGISVYTDWKEESLLEGMREEGSLFFVLTNSRSFSAEESEREHRKIASGTVKAAAAAGKDFLLVSRGDSTLRGHYPLELEALKNVLESETGKKIDGQILCPYFQEGGRFTIDSVHYVRDGEWLVPAGDTEFAGDKTFGYSSSHLGDYMEEKSGGRYKRENGIYITLPMLRGLQYDEITGMLLKAEAFTGIAVDAVCESDVKIFATALLRAMKKGKEFLIRCAAAVPKVLGNISDRPLLTRQELLGSESALDTKERLPAYGGIVLIGSHVKKTTQQLESLRHTKVPIELLEFQVNTCFEKGGLERETKRLITEAEDVMESGRTAVVYTSRTLLAPGGMSSEELLKLSVSISGAVTGVIAGLHRKPAFIIAKGGITSSDVGTKALGVKKALVLGQAQPGIPVWKTGPESKFPGISYIIFPGNVGDKDTLRKIVEELA